MEGLQSSKAAKSKSPTTVSEFSPTSRGEEAEEGKTLLVSINTVRFALYRLRTNASSSVEGLMKSGAEVPN